MPPAVSDSEPESLSREDIPPTKAGTKQIEAREEPPSDAEEVGKENEAEDEADGDEEDGDDDDEDAEVYQVEEILDHDWKDGVLKYEIKWLGYDDPVDRTWEIEEHLSGAKEVLRQYLKKIGGKPEPPAGSKKRGRKSTGKVDTLEQPAKKVRSDDEPAKKKDGRGRKRKSEANAEVEMMDVEETTRDGWEPPKPLPGAWEEGVVEVHTIEGTDDGTKFAYLMWADEGEDGKKRQTKAKLSTCYIACPQIMLKFFESHLVFTDKATSKKPNGT